MGELDAQPGHSLPCTFCAHPVSFVPVPPSVVNKKTPIVILVALGIYAVAILTWAVLFFAASRARAEDEECSLGIRTMSEAWMFSLETMTTLGYGVPQGQDVYFHSCPSLLVLISSESLCSVLLDAVAIGIVFMRISRAQSRAASVIFSSHAVLRRIRGDKPRAGVKR